MRPSETDKRFMKKVIAACRAGIREGQTPFAAGVVKDGKFLSCAHNRVWKNCDITAHGEVQAIREACRKIKGIDLSGATIYSTCEPCPMCFSAIHWSRISRIVYGAEIADAKKAGFNELKISNRQLKKMGKSAVEIRSGVLRKECADLFDKWKRRNGSRTY